MCKWPSGRNPGNMLCNWCNRLINRIVSYRIRHTPRTHTDTHSNIATIKRWLQTMLLLAVMREKSQSLDCSACSSCEILGREFLFTHLLNYWSRERVFVPFRSVGRLCFKSRTHSISTLPLTRTRALSRFTKRNVRWIHGSQESFVFPIYHRFSFLFRFHSLFFFVFNFLSGHRRVYCCCWSSSYWTNQQINHFHSIILMEMAI